MATLTPQIHIEINPVFFVFSYKDVQRKVATLVGVDTLGREIIAIGERPDHPDVITVALFGPNERMPEGFDRFSLLQSYLEYNIARLFETQKLPVFRPTLIFHNDAVLEGVMCGYQRTLLEMAAQGAGAKDARFE